MTTYTKELMFHTKRVQEAVIVANVIWLLNSDCLYFMRADIKKGLSFFAESLI
jgi:hypothetical protein